MSSRKNESLAIQKINEHGVLLVFPILNRKEPRSLWSELYPRSTMEWRWDEHADGRVEKLWNLMKRLSVGKEVVYSKWYQGRATFFSRRLFAALCATLNSKPPRLSPTAQVLYEALEMDSPLSTKELKRATDLQGRFNESTYQKGLKELFQRFLVVGFGEVHDGAFPSLAVGATQNLYEDLWIEAQSLSKKEARSIVDAHFSEGTALSKFLEKIKKNCEVSES